MNSRRKSASGTGQSQPLRASSRTRKKPDASLYEAFMALMRKSWRTSFPQERSFIRLVDIMTSILAGVGRRTIAGAIEFRGKDQESWTADYRVFSKSPWEPENLFRGVLEASIPYLPVDRPVVLALDDTSLDRTSERIEGTRWCHDPLGPKFLDLNLKWAIPMLHAALLLPPGASKRPTAITVAFEPILGRARKKNRGGKRGRPGKVAGTQTVVIPPPTASIAAIKTPPISTELAVEIIRRIRNWLDDFGIQRKLIVVVDSSYCNRTVISGLPDRTELVGRTRIDAGITQPLPVKCGKRIYGNSIPTPKEIGESPLFPEFKDTFVLGCDDYPVRYKEVNPVLWKNGTKARLMRLLVLQPIRHGPKGKRGYSRPGYLFTTDLGESAHTLIQAYLCRWEIEVLHRILKSDVGISQTQCRKASAKIYAAISAAYALFTLASRQVTGETRSAMHHQLSKWQQNHRTWRENKRRMEGRPIPVYRATVRDNVTLLRKSLGLRWMNGVSRRR